MGGPPPDTEPVVHNLYVLVVSGTSAAAHDRKSRELTLAILKYINDRLPLLAKMGVKIWVHKVKKSDLGNARLVDAMKQRGIFSLPALVTPNSTYRGNRSIGEVYDKNIAKYQTIMRQGVVAPSGTARDDDALASFYRSEMTFEKAVADDGLGDGEGDDILGEGGDMMNGYRQMMQRREARNTKDPGGGQTTPGGSATPKKPSGGPAFARRSDNVSGGEDDSTMDTLIKRMADAIESQPFEDAFAGGDGLDLEGGHSAQDDLMENAYWANQELSV